MKRQKSLVLGANGFLGQKLSNSLVDNGHDVVLFDRFSRGVTAEMESRFEVRTGDFLNRADLARAIDGVDNVFHFISATTPATAHADPMMDLHSNVEPSVELFSRCADAGIKVYFASTGGAIYGDRDDGIFSENTLTEPISPYAIGKLTIENYLRYFNVTRELDYCVFRISNPYGPGQRGVKRQGLIGVAVDKIAKGLPVQVYGDGSMVRDYIYIDDLVEMIVRISQGESNERVFNVGSGIGHSIVEILETLERVSGRPIGIEHVAAPGTFLARAVLDISRYESEFGVAPSRGLGEGIGLTWADAQSRIERAI